MKTVESSSSARPFSWSNRLAARCGPDEFAQTVEATMYVTFGGGEVTKDVNVLVVGLGDLSWTLDCDEWWTLEEPEDQRLKERILYHLSMNPGQDAKDVAEFFGIPGIQAVTLVQEMLQDGILDFDE